MKLDTTQRLTAVFDPAAPASAPAADLAPWLEDEYTLEHARYTFGRRFYDESAVTRVDLPVVKD